MSGVRFEDSILGQMLMKHKLGCLLPFVLTIIATIGFIIYKNWDAIQKMMN